MYVAQCAAVGIIGIPGLIEDDLCSTARLRPSSGKPALSCISNNTNDDARKYGGGRAHQPLSSAGASQLLPKTAETLSPDVIASVSGWGGDSRPFLLCSRWAGYDLGR